MLKKLRTFALVALCGGMLFQTASTGCSEIIAPIIATIVSSVVSSAIGGALGT
jgi:hypothetical protein